MNKLDVGCGRNKLAGYMGLDIAALPSVDIVHDVNVTPWPVADNSCDAVCMRHLIEHCDSIPRVMEEVHRILIPGGIVEIVTPHYTDTISWKDITHKWHLSTKSFEYFEPDNGTSYYSKARFETVDSYVELANPFRYAGLEFLVNLQRKSGVWRFFRRWWELYLCFVIRGKTMHFKLKALK
ncbi:MAG: class I SAM-dependent methyltransferase [Elusimicrobiales bacterium]